MSTYAIATVTLKVHCGQGWSDQERLSVIREEAIEQAMENIRRACSHSRGAFQIVGTPEVMSIQTTTDN